MAPEVFSDSGYSYEADIFGLGAVFFNLLTSRFLFAGKNHEEILDQNKECNIWPARPFIKNFSFQCQDLLIRMI